MEGERLVGTSENPSDLRNPARLGPPARDAKTRAWGGYPAQRGGEGQGVWQVGPQEHTRRPGSYSLVAFPCPAALGSY